MNPQGSWRVFVDGDWQQQHVQIKAQAPTAEELNELEKELLRMSSLKMASPSPKSGRNYIDDKPILPSSIATPFQGSNGDKPSGDGVGDVDVGGNGGSIMGASGPPSLSGRASPRRHWASHHPRLELQLPTWTQMEASGKCPCKAGEAACRAGAHQHPFPGPLQHLRMEACPPIRSSWQKELQQWKLRAVLRRCRS